MTAANDPFESLTAITAERLLYDIQALIDRHGLEKGQRIAEMALTAMAKMPLDSASEMQPLNKLERKAVACAVKLALATLRTEEKIRN